MTLPGPIAREVTNRLGDLYMDFTHPATRERVEFVKYRQATNHLAEERAAEYLRAYAALVLRDLAASLESLGTPDGSSLIGPIGLRDLADGFETGPHFGPTPPPEPTPRWDLP